MDVETKTLLVKDAAVILAVFGALLAFYTVIVLVSALAKIPLP